MQSLYIFVAIIVFFVVALTIWNASQRAKGNDQQQSSTDNNNDGCCGMHEVCEKDSLIAAFTKEPEYFDDEELDRFVGREASEYSDNEADEFREVFYSVLDEEKPRWVRSLQVRGIAVPNQMKDEILIVVADLRQRKMQHA